MKTIISKFLMIMYCSYWLQNLQAQDPNWSVNTSNYQYSMTFTTFLNVEGKTLTATNDKVGAFVNGEIRGVANVIYVASVQKYVAYLSVYANTNNETIHFKIYDSTTDLIVNIDDKYAPKFLDIKVDKKLAFSLSDVKPYTTTEQNTILTIDGKEINTKLVGEFNIYNILAAVSFAKNQNKTINSTDEVNDYCVPVGDEWDYFYIEDFVDCTVWEK